jgi:hypothetical protein
MNNLKLFIVLAAVGLLTLVVRQKAASVNVNAN